jgi:hypothetical protein
MSNVTNPFETLHTVIFDTRSKLGANGASALCILPNRLARAPTARV